jgi:hypothetical protein
MGLLHITFYNDLSPSLEPVGYSALGQIIGANFNFDFIPYEYLDLVLLHLAAGIAQHSMTIL